MSLDRMPIDVLLQIYSWLNPEDMAKVAQVNKQSKRIQDAQYIWKQKFKLHFPYLLKRMKVKPNHNWYQAFKDAYNQEYKSLPPRMR